MRRSTPRGFSLIELMVASGVAIVLLTSALALMSRLMAFNRRQQWTEATRRSTTLMLTQLESELRRVGLGRPTGIHLEGQREVFPPPILQASPQRLAFIADVPHPESDFNGLSMLAADLGTPPITNLPILNELSGNCVPTAAGGNCDTRLTSLLFPGDTLLCDDANPLVRSCPWGANRYRNNETIIVSSGAGQWVERQITGLGASVGGRYMLRIDSAIPPNMQSRNSLGFVSTPDRIIYQVRTENSTNPPYVVVERDQCWGDYTDGSNNLIATTNLINNCTAGARTGFEPLLEYDFDAAHPVANSFIFTYYDAAGNPLVPSGSPLQLTETQRWLVREVRVKLHIFRQPPAADRRNQSPIEFDTRLNVMLRN